MLTIESLGVYLPSKIVTTSEVLAGCSRPLAFPLERLTGVRSRRIVGEGEFSIDLARNAVEDCLTRSAYRPDEIGLVICANISRWDGPELRVSYEPCTAVKLRDRFGLENALAFDICNACPGVFTAITIVQAFMDAGVIDSALVVSGEYISHLIQSAQQEIDGYLDPRLACLTLGDAGIAMTLERSEDGETGFHALEMFTLGAYSTYCIAKATEAEHGGAIMLTDAMNLTQVAIEQGSRHALEMLDRTEWEPESFQHLIMHQTSSTSIRSAMRAINGLLNREVCRRENTVFNLAERGNTATTSHFVALMDGIRSGRIRSRDRLIFGISGSGVTLGTALYTLDGLPDRVQAAGPDGARAHARPAPRAPSAASARIRIESVGRADAPEAGTANTLAMLRAAGEDCFRNSAYTRSDISRLIHAGVYRSDFLSEPALAALAVGELDINASAESLGSKKTLAFDVFNGAVGFLNACHVGVQLIRSEQADTVMVLASEVENNAARVPDRLLGLRETASALILDESSDGVGFGGFQFTYLTEHLESLRADAVLVGGRPVVVASRDEHLAARYLEGIEAAVAELLRREEVARDQVTVVLPPQFSRDFIAALEGRLALRSARFVDVVQDGKDLFTSAVPYAFSAALSRGLARPGDVGLVISAGSGLQVGCALYYF